MASLIQESREIGASEFFRLPWYFRCFRIIAEFEPIGAFELITVSRDWSPDKTNERPHRTAIFEFIKGPLFWITTSPDQSH